MDEQKHSGQNIAFFTDKEAIYVAITTVLWGTIMQQFLLYRDVSPALVGVYTTLVSAVQMVAMMLFSGVSERTSTPLKYCTRILLGICGITLLYLPIIFFDIGSHLTVFLVCLFSIVQIQTYLPKNKR